MLVKEAQKYVGLYVKVYLFDGTNYYGRLGHNTKELPKNMYFINDVYFRASHIKKIVIDNQYF